MGEVLEDAQEGGTSADRIARWSKLASEFGFMDFLSPEDGFKTCVDSGGAWGNKDQPGTTTLNSGSHCPQAGRADDAAALQYSSLADGP